MTCSIQSTLFTTPESRGRVHSLTETNAQLTSLLRAMVWLVVVTNVVTPLQAQTLHGDFPETTDEAGPGAVYPGSVDAMTKTTVRFTSAEGSTAWGA